MRNESSGLVYASVKRTTAHPKALLCLLQYLTTTLLPLPTVAWVQTFSTPSRVSPCTRSNLRFPSFHPYNHSFAMQPDSFKNDTTSHIQPRFVRQQNDSTQHNSKSRFTLRAKHIMPPFFLDRILTTLRIRRNKRTRSGLALTVLALAICLCLVVLFSMAHPFTFTRIPPSHFATIPASTSNLSIVRNPSPPEHDLPPDGPLEDPRAPLDADQPNLQQRDAHEIPKDNQQPQLHIDEQEAPLSSAVKLPSPHSNTEMQSIRGQYGSANMSIVVLFHNEFDSLKSALKSWIDKGLIDYVQEIVFFLNGLHDDEYFKLSIPDYKRIPADKRRVVPSSENLPLGLAITKMIEIAKSEYILLLEKDWELIEPREVMVSRLTDSKVLVGTGVANLVRHRHRDNPGVPLHALIMHQGREESIMRQQENLLCFVHHWQKDPTVTYPGKGIMYRCGGTERYVEEEDVFCSSSVYCQWNNNPGLFKRQWFLDEIGERFRKEYDIEFGKYGKKSPFLDFEYYTNWRSYAWRDKNITVAVGAGLFRHAESEHQHFNTVWYAHFRLVEELKEIREFYLKNETRFKQLGGVHYDPSSPPPPTMMERYPVEFVRKYQFPDMFTGGLEIQKQMIDMQYRKFQEKYRILSEEEWKSTGPKSEKAQRNVDWRGHITSLHHTVETAMMIAPPKQPHEMSITLVTCLLDIGRDELADDGYQFRREFQMYLDALTDWLRHRYPKVVYTSKQIADEVSKAMSEESKSTTKFIYTNRKELETKWVGRDNYARIQEIRTSSEWIKRASWLENSPQAGLKDYNPLVMSKMFMMRDAARENYWDTSHFLFVDAKHNCRNPDIMTPKNDHIIRAHMFDHFLLTTFDYTPANEVHGFEYSAFNSYCNLKNSSQRQVVKVGRGGIFGGSGFVLEYMVAMYDVALTATLREGLMGTEENILSILRSQVQQYVDDFSNSWACAKNLKGDHTCKDKQEQGYNCAIFDWVSRDAVRER